MLVLLPLLALSSAAAAALVPGPTGPFSVAMKVQALNDTSRRDPLDPTGRSPSRRVLFSAFLPVRGACPGEALPYMTPSVAAWYGAQAAANGLPGDLFSGFQMEVCDLDKLPACGREKSKQQKYPLVLFTPGFGDSRLMYGAMARSLASQGYAVVTVDHPFDAMSVEFPDGTIIPGANFTEDAATLSKVVQVRNDDMSFIINQLHNRTIRDPLLANFPGSLALDKIVVIGHSLGGAAAAALTRSDTRVLGGVDLDGQLADPVKSLGLSKPFLLAGRPGHAAEDATWDEFWPHLRGPRAQLAINGTEHGSFTDRPALLSVFDFPPPVKQALQGLLGSIDSKRMDVVLNGVLGRFFELALYGRDGPFRGVEQAFAEVSVARSHL
ncbi:Platelet-activating factor acetylhydrolase [Tolypocladium ophioglossoides CBS 100239]|uniref:1-alkyl-2-acetylglycerophosphocholine esterase n=1 Tax=Tolypocladium ophioglossoides (strain CBS 100239) TaxID=1163406 RepID=A0A0L0NI49_TOLOC|nr:Platelet-activating factor acetylhydrolase [Tolypocladium ophioglossoides CBS 100239]